MFIHKVNGGQSKDSCKIFLRESNGFLQHLRNSNPGNCTVTLTHSRTKNLTEKVLQADIIIAAIGKPGFVTADMVKEGAVVVDVGTTRVPDASKKSGWALKGDVLFDEVAPKCSFITPVPGGVGPMTIASLMINTLRSMDLRGK